MNILHHLKRFIFGARASSFSPPTPRTDTEYTAEVVTVSKLKPHPNADRLEIANFMLKGIGETTYEVVVQKGKFRLGDYACYFSVDCLLPTSHRDFAFLKERLDGKGKDVFRLKAARLRGVFSQGLLVPIAGSQLLTADYQYGADVSKLYGVTYHRDPEPEVGGATAPRKPKPQVAPVYSVDSLKKTPALFAETEPVYITEKIHGTNFRFGWVRRRFLGIPCGWRFFVGSHRTERNGKSGTSWYGEDLYSRAANAMGLADLTRNHKGLIFYGELYGHTYDGKPIQPGWTYGRKLEDGPGLVIFDIRDQSEGCWLGAFDRWDIANDVGLKNAPVLAAYTDAVAREEWEGRMSTLDSTTIMEGVVVESLSGPRRKAKYVHKAYLEAQ